ncbi:MAG: hypothetical protein JHC95_05115, partial [Solirubrobacteraceae bacterium]|nr:hypothetical protein [Solirubrobacteraceae bacterium]
MPRPPLLAIVAIALAGLLAPALAVSAGGGGGPITALNAGATHGDRIPPGADDDLRRKLRAIRSDRMSAASASNGLADGLWCGVEQTRDDTAYQAHTGPREKVIYAYPSDRPNRFTTMRDLIQADARDMADVLLNASGGRKTLRFDVGTKCGAGYVDI